MSKINWNENGWTVIQESDPPYHARMVFFIGPLGEQVEFYRPED